MNILQATGEELSRLAGEILLGDGPYPHKPGVLYDSMCVCKKCGKQELFEKLQENDCPVRCSIPLTWPEAMKWRDWAVEKCFAVNFTDALLEVAWNEKTFPSIKSAKPSWEERVRFWDKVACLDILAFALPEHYIKAACLCKLESDGE